MKSTVAKSELYYGDDVLWEGICKNQNRSILGSEANYFRYRCDAESRSLILWTERNPVESEEYISLVDIKDFIYCSNREIRSLLYNSNYIEKILELCKDEVKRFKKQYIK